MMEPRNQTRFVARYVRPDGVGAYGTRDKRGPFNINRSGRRWAPRPHR